jgi:hypothetical protein
MTTIRTARLSQVGVALLAGMVTTAACAQSAPSWLGGAGATQCAKWLAERENKASVLASGLEGWVLGFVSGANAGYAAANDITGPANILAGFSEADVLARVDFYCRAHTSDMLFAAVNVVTADLMDAVASRIRKNKEPPKQ